LKILYWSPSKYYYKLILITALLSCGSGVSGKNINKTGGISGIANPASVNCINKGEPFQFKKGKMVGSTGSASLTMVNNVKSGHFFGANVLRVGKRS
jgi:putative hemolysin